MPQTAPTADQVRVALDELLGWQGISRSPQLSDLLRYVVEKTLSGDEASIKAYSIAVDVLGRPQSFDPQSDPIVRVQARRLRTLLEQYYDTGTSSSSVQIHLPLGRYVPEFTVAPPLTEPIPQQGSPVAGERVSTPLLAQPPPVRLQRFLLNAFLGLCFTLLGVGLAVLLIRWTVPTAVQPAPAQAPDFPAVAVGSFDNLTGDSSLDDEIAQFGPRLATALGKFDTIRVVPDGDGLSVHGVIQENAGQFSVRVLLSQGTSSGIVWSTALSRPAAPSARGLSDILLALAAQLGNANGPLHLPNRAWLKTHASLAEHPGLYVCQLHYMGWRDSRRIDDANGTIDCFNRIIATEPENGVALAANAGISAWRAHYVADAGADLVALMTQQTTAAARAVSLKPADSFVYEQEGLVLARQGSLDAALGALNKAMDLNPASMDAVATAALVTWLAGNFDLGNALSERALAAIPSPPPWYYMTRSFNALRERRFYDAIDAAQAVASGDEEMGPIVALAAAPIVGRNDIIDRYRPMVLANPNFEAAGIMPRIGMLMKPKVLLDRVREGLVLAGVPPAALDGPFNSDGTPRK